MSDYLNKLVLRTLGTSPVAQPLMTPFYAADLTRPDQPLSPTVTLRPGGDSSDDSLGATNFANNELVPNQRAAIVRDQTASLDKQANPPNLAAITEPNMPLIPDLTDPANVAKVEMPRQPAPAAQQSPKVAASTASEAPGERQADPVIRSALPQSEPKRSGARQLVQPATQPVELMGDRRLVANHQASPTLVQAGPRAMQLTEATQSPFVAPPTATPVERRNSQPREVASERAATPTPTIQVTIGRVEVRAIQPPAPAVRAQPKAATPAIALEDYLRGQTGGQR
ncbi:MAG: hypothetical protein NT075_17525 [Chloroflexi bacterium]|nr:hypothetical protein [Chloroflexota bacterium]